MRKEIGDWVWKFHVVEFFIFLAGVVTAIFHPTFSLEERIFITAFSSIFLIVALLGERDRRRRIKKAPFGGE